MDFQNSFSQTISLHTVKKKVSTSKKLVITCPFKNHVFSRFQYKCRKNKAKCSQYCYLTRRNSGNAGIVKKDTDTAIVSKSESREDNPQTGSNISILPYPQSFNLTKRRGANINSPH